MLWTNNPSVSCAVSKSKTSYLTYLVQPFMDMISPWIRGLRQVTREVGESSHGWNLVDCEVLGLGKFLLMVE